MPRGGPTAHVEPDLGDELKRSIGADAGHLGKVDAAGE